MLCAKGLELEHGQARVGHRAIFNNNIVVHCFVFSGYPRTNYS